MGTLVWIFQRLCREIKVFGNYAFRDTKCKRWLALRKRQGPAQAVEVGTPTRWKASRAAPQEQNTSVNLNSAGRQVLSGGSRQIGLGARMEAPLCTSETRSLELRPNPGSGLGSRHHRTFQSIRRRKNWNPENGGREDGRTGTHRGMATGPRLGLTLSW